MANDQARESARSSNKPVVFNAISGNGKQIEGGGSGKVSGKKVAKRLVVRMARNDRKKRAKAFFLIAAKRRSIYSARACKG